MNTTLHALQRMSQRGVSRDMVELVLEHGKFSRKGRVTLGRKDAQKLLSKMKDQMRTLKKIVDKGGLVVVAENDQLITTYNYKQ